MAIGSLGSLVVSMALDTARFEGDLGKAAAIAERRARQISRTFNTLATFVSGGLFVRFISDAAAAGDALVSMAERTGRSVESLSQLDYVAKRGNTSIEALLKSQDQLAKNLGATDEEGKRAVKALAEIGLEAAHIRSLAPDQKLEAVAEAMGAIVDPARRARLEMALFGKAGTEIDNVLRGGAEGIRALREEADRLGITVTDLEARRLAKLDDQLEATKGQFNRLKLEIAGVIAQPIGSYLELVSNGLQGWRVLLGLTGEEMENLNSRVAQLTLERQRLNGLVEAGQARDVDRARLAAIREEMELIREKQEFLLGEALARTRYEAATAQIRQRQEEESEKASKRAEEEAEAAEAAAKAYAKWRAELTAIVEHEKMLNELELKWPTPVLDDTAFEREIGRTGEIIRKQTEEDQKVLDGMYEDLAKSFGEKSEELSIVGEQAARNIQSHFADFLFDPFDKGIKGMLAGFVDVLRRMVAEAGAAQILKAIGLGSDGGGWLGTILGGLFGGLASGASSGGGGGGSSGRFAGFRAGGGGIGPRQWGIVGEKGPEIAFGGSSGKTIVPMGRGAGITYAPTYNYQGGPGGEQLVAFGELVKQDVIDHMGGLIRGGAYA